MKTLTELRKFNTAHAARGTIKYGQSQLDISDEMDLERDRARYEADRAKDLALAATHGIDEVMKAQKLDALLFPGASGAASPPSPGIRRSSCRSGRAQRADAGVSGGLRGAAGAVRRQLHRHGVRASRG